MRVYSAAEVHDALAWEPLAQAIRSAFARGASVPLRHAHALAEADTLLLMPAWDDRHAITKIVTVIPGAPHTVQASVVLLDRASGDPLAFIEGESLTVRRTAATSAMVARTLARADASRLLVVGSGRLAAWMARAHAALRPGLTQVELWARRPEAAASLAATLLGEGLPARAVADLPAAVSAAHIVCCATTASEPVVRGEWLAPGVHLDLVGAFRPSMREVDDAAVQRAHLVVDTYAGALAEAGDLVQPMRAGLIGREQVAAELGELWRDEASERRLGRRDDSTITLFKSVGTAIEDLAAAELVYESLRR